MRTEKRNPAPGDAGNGAQESGQLASKSTTSARPGKRLWTKRRRVLLNLIRRPSLHRFQAERIGEHCLHTTVAAWQADGVEVAREFIQVRGWGGEPTTVARYYLTPEQRETATDRLARELTAAGAAESYDEAVAFITSGGREAR
ncbi:MAG: hypothetical protein FKY71_10585 [Spiribacter salinus]|uniref:Uncharacterized protein n=1 Tax=Spiribacter salinus TaxID=1335746 RepID=A0A540VQM2_9GAMM|nr:MAG: hypothetical protein FKY71_10585 [Spiribacter salinus]